MYTYIHIFLLNHLCLCTGGMERERTTAGTGALADGSADTGAREVRGDGVVWKSLDAHVADVRELARSMRSRSPGQMVTTKRCLCVSVRVLYVCALLCVNGHSLSYLPQLHLQHPSSYPIFHNFISNTPHLILSSTTSSLSSTTSSLTPLILSYLPQLHL